jgi:hypothetical protein
MKALSALNHKASNTSQDANRKYIIYMENARGKTKEDQTKAPVEQVGV